MVSTKTACAIAAAAVLGASVSFTLKSLVSVPAATLDLSFTSLQVALHISAYGSCILTMLYYCSHFLPAVIAARALFLVALAINQSFHLTLVAVRAALFPGTVDPTEPINVLFSIGVVLLATNVLTELMLKSQSKHAKAVQSFTAHYLWFLFFFAYNALSLMDMQQGKPWNLRRVSGACLANGMLLLRVSTFITAKGSKIKQP